nr:MAG TPA: baseplate wedge protein [Caudoviricetes sp.]
MWDGIAFKVYGSEAYMNVLLEANQEYAHYVILPANLILKCPDANIRAAINLPPWRR